MARSKTSEEQPQVLRLRSPRRPALRMTSHFLTLRMASGGGWLGRKPPKNNRRSFDCGRCAAYAQDDKPIFNAQDGKRGGWLGRNAPKNSRRSFDCGCCAAYAQDDKPSFNAQDDKHQGFSSNSE